MRLEECDQAHEVLRARRPCKPWKPDSKRKARGRKNLPGDKLPAFARALAEGVVGEHEEGSLSLVVCNTVLVAQRVYAAIRDACTGASDVVLLTSRFRAGDRKESQGKLLAFEAARKRAVTDGSVSVPGLICVSTQVIEAGVDISTRRLWSEIAPWPSLIQRFGRLNRDGRLNGDARACFWEGPEKPKRSERFIGPYEAEAVKLGTQARRRAGRRMRIRGHTVRKGCPGESERKGSNQGVGREGACSRAGTVSEGRRRTRTFSTEPDVVGGFTDVSPFVRSQDENADVAVFWREWRSEAELRRSEDLVGPAFARDEGCAVAAGRLRGFLEKRRAWTWDDKREAWGSVRAGDVRPGMLLMLRRDDGGYSRELGWTGSRTDKLDEALPPGEPHERFADDRYSEGGAWVTLTDHLRDTAREAAQVVQALSLDDDLGSAVIRASSEHDIGKALPQWQGALPKPPPGGTACGPRRRISSRSSQTPLRQRRRPRSFFERAACATVEPSRRNRTSRAAKPGSRGTRSPMCLVRFSNASVPCRA